MSSLDLRYAVAEMSVDILNFYGNYPDYSVAVNKAERMAEASGYLNTWVVFAYDGYNKWRATDYRVVKPQEGCK